MKAFSNAVSLAAMILGCAVAAYSQTPPPAVVAGGVLNGASFDKTGQPVAPGSLASIFGTDLSAALAAADSIPLATTLSNVSVTINNVPAPLVFVSGGQINAQIPWNTATGTAQVVVNRNGVASAPATVSVGTAAPGIFTFPGGVGQAIAYGLDGAIAAPTGSPLPYPSHPVKAGDALIILGTGLGAVNPPVSNGGIPAPGVLTNTVVMPTVTVGGVQAQVLFSGLSAYVGVDQINIVIPTGVTPGNAVSLQMAMNGITSTNQVTIAVSQ